VTLWFALQLHERRSFSFCLAAIDELINGGDVVIVGITTALTDVDKRILGVRIYSGILVEYVHS
jgi:hypothetical protein